jgi:hypothetical protein
MNSKKLWMEYVEYLTRNGKVKDLLHLNALIIGFWSRGIHGGCLVRSWSSMRMVVFGGFHENLRNTTQLLVDLTKM